MAGPVRNVEYLEEHGPTRLSGLPCKFSLSDRRAGAARLKIDAGGARGRPEPVAYLFESHTAEAVVAEFIVANSDFIERTPRRALIHHFRGCGEEFKAAADELLAPYDWSEHGTGEPRIREAGPDKDDASWLTRLARRVLGPGGSGGER